MAEPRCFDIELTSRCGLRCPYCYLGKPGQSSMTEETAEQAIAYMTARRSKLPPYGQIELNLYGGEPFLNFPIAQKLVESCPWARSTIFTNGATATPSQIAWCRDYGVTAKRSTGGCPESSEIIRPGEFYVNRWISEGRLWGENEYAATHRLVVTPATAHTVCKSVAWLRKWGYYGDVDLAADDYVSWPKEATAAYKGQLRTLAESVVEQYNAGHVLGIENFRNFGRSIFGQGGVMVIGCGAATNTIGIAWDGLITPCHRFFRDRAGCGTLGEVLLGNPVRFACDVEGTIETWKSGQERSECQDCSARQPCARGCMHVAAMTCGTLNGSPIARCNFIRMYAHFARWIADRLPNIKWWEQASTPCPTLNMTE